MPFITVGTVGKFTQLAEVRLVLICSLKAVPLVGHEKVRLLLELVTMSDGGCQKKILSLLLFTAIAIRLPSTDKAEGPQDLFGA